MKKLIILLSTLLFAITFPALKGRVVDEANILSPQTKKILEEKLKNFEQNTSNQIVVVTLKSLQGHSIEEYGYRLGRHWGIGQKGKNNGVLLIVAPNERKVRIEVGYGLEGTLTDAKAFLIIHDDIIPYFKKGDYDKGVLKGVEKIIQTIKNTYKNDKKDSDEKTPLYFFAFMFVGVLLTSFIKFLKPIVPAVFFSGISGLLAYSFFDSTLIGVIVSVIVFIFLAFYYFNKPKKTAKNQDFGTIVGDYSNIDRSNYDSFGSNDFGGGFSGGGGDFGGGGSSGNW